MQDSLQSKLIKAYELIGSHTKNEARFKRIVDAIKNVEIPPDDYEKVLKLMFSTLMQHPEIMDNAPYDKLFKDLCKSCLYQVSITNVQTPRSKPSTK